VAARPDAEFEPRENVRTEIDRRRSRRNAAVAAGEDRKCERLSPLRIERGPVNRAEAVGIFRARRRRDDELVPLPGLHRCLRRDRDDARHRIIGNRRGRERVSAAVFQNESRPHDAERHEQPVERKLDRLPGRYGHVCSRDDLDRRTADGRFIALGSLIAGRSARDQCDQLSE